MQINSINPINNKHIPKFRAQEARVVIITGDAYRKSDLIKSRFKEILNQLSLNESFIKDIVEEFKRIKISKNALKIAVSSSDEVRISLPKGVDGNVFVLQTLKDEKPTGTVIMDKDLCLLDSYSLNTEKYLNPADYKKANVDNTVSNVFEASNLLLGEIDNFIKNKLEKGTFLASNGAIIKKASKTSKPSKPTGSYVPPSSEWQNFSMTEVIRQNASQKEKPKAVKNNRLQKVLEKQRAIASTVRQKQVSTSGVLSDDFLAKINEIKKLYEEIKGILNDKTPLTRCRIYEGFPNLTRNGSKGFSFQDVKFIFPQTFKENEELLTIKEPDGSAFIHLTTSGKILDFNEEKLNTIKFYENPKYFSQEEIDKKIKEDSFNDLIDKSLENLKEFKEYIYNQGWRVRKSREISSLNNGTIDNGLQEKLKFIKSKYDNIKALSKNLSNYNLSKVKIFYGDIITTATSRLEFINTHNDGKNIVFDFSNNKYGEFYKIAKYSGGDNIEELYVITPEGKMVKNTVKHLGLKSVFPTGSQATIRYFSNEELADFDLKSFEKILNSLIEKTSEYETYIQDYIHKDNGKPIRHIRKEPCKKQAKQEFSYDVVKDFLNKTAQEVQESADKLREAVGFKSALDSLAEDLSKKFEDFLKQFEAK